MDGCKSRSKDCFEPSSHQLLAHLNEIIGPNISKKYNELTHAQILLLYSKVILIGGRVFGGEMVTLHHARGQSLAE